MERRSRVTRRRGPGGRTRGRRATILGGPDPGTAYSRAVRYTGIGGDRASVIGLGTWQFGSQEWGWGRDFTESDAEAVVNRALDLGINVIDTAEVYGRGRSEAILGEALRGRRDEAFIATKFAPIVPVPRMVERAAEGSLRRLRVGAVDLYQLHWPNPFVPLSVTMAGMRTLVEAGKVRHVGVSNYSLAGWAAAEREMRGPVATNQVQYSLVRRSPERELIPWARRNGRTVIAYSPLAQGALSGRYRGGDAPGGVRSLNPLFTPANLGRLRPLLDALQDVAATHGATPSQIALAWTIHGPNVVAIPGAKNVAQLESNAAAADIELSDDEYTALTRAADSFRRTLIGALPQMPGRLLRRP